jgi:hypothetical protein
MMLFVVAASKKQFASFISSLHGRVANLLHHTIGAAGVRSKLPIFFSHVCRELPK